jgi:hypothetical protein
MHPSPGSHSFAFNVPHFEDFCVALCCWWCEILQEQNWKHAFPFRNSAHHLNLALFSSGDPLSIMQTVHVSMHTTSAEVVVLEEQSGDESAQQLLNSQNQLKLEHSFDLYPEADHVVKPSESASTSAMLPYFAVHPAAPLTINCKSSTLPAETSSFCGPHNLTLNNGTLYTTVHLREKQFSSSPNEEASLIFSSQQKSRI